MADCRDGCTTDEIFGTLTNRVGTSYSLTLFTDDGVGFGEDEIMPQISRASDSSIAVYGHNYVLRPATFNVKCDDDAKDLDDDWIASPRDFMCCDITIDSPCCNGVVTLTNANVTSFKRPDMSTDPDASDAYVITFTGKPV